MYIILVSFYWLLLCFSICQRSESNSQNKRNGYSISAFWKRGKGIDIDLNSLPPVEEEFASLDQHNDHVILPTIASIDPKEAERKERKRLYAQRKRREQKALRNEIKKDPSKLTPELQREMDRQNAMQRKRQKRYYDSLTQKAKENKFSSVTQQINWQRMSHKSGWRKESSKDEELYQRHLGRVRDWKRRKAAGKKASKKSSLQKRNLLPDSDNSFHKRAGLELDLNSSPPKEDDGEDHHSLARDIAKDSLHIAPAIRKPGGRPKMYTAAELRARKNSYQNQKRREQMIRFNEAKKDPTKLTPELKREMDHHYSYQRTRQRHYHLNIAQKVRNGKEVTPQQFKAFHRKHATVIWRAASPSNEKKYQKRLKRERERQRDRKKAMKAENNNDESDVLFKRALDSDIDLNKSPPSEVEEVNKEKSHMDKSGKVQVAKSKPRQKKRKSLTAEESKTIGRINARNFRERRRARFAEAQADANKMTPNVKEEIERYYRTARAGSNKYYHSIQDKVKANAGISPVQLKVFHQQHKSKAWRNASAENEAAYQRHLEHNRKKRQDKKNEKAQNSESKMQKRGISSDSISEHMNDDVVRHNNTPSTFAQSPAPTPASADGTEPMNLFALKKSKRQRKTAEEKKQSRTAINQRYRAKRRILWQEALSDPTKMTPKLEAQMKRHNDSRNIRSKRYYRSISEKIKNNTAITPAQFKHYHTLHRTPNWRAASSENQAAYEKHKSDNRKRRKEQRKRRKEADLQSTSGSPLERRGLSIYVGLNHSSPREEGVVANLLVGFQKRGLDVDLNELPPEPEQNVEPIIVEHAGGPNEQVSSGKKKRKRKELTQEEKKGKNVRSAELRRQRKAKWREAMKDPSTVTPEIKSAYERHQTTARRLASRAYHTLRQKVKEGKPLTPYENRRNQFITKSKEWRENPANRKQYEKRLEADRNYKRTKRQSQIAQAKQQQVDGLHPRALEAGIDLNRPPPTEVAEDSHVQQHVPKLKLSPIERGEIKRTKRREQKRRQAINRREVKENPSNATPEMQESLRKYQERTRKSSQRQHQLLKDRIKQDQPLTDAQTKRIHFLNRSKQWREADPKNRAQYEEHLRRMREKYQKKKALKNANPTAKDSLSEARSKRV